MGRKNKRLTQKLKVLEFLKRGYKLNALVALRELNCISTSLVCLIHTLRSEGWDIQTEFKKAYSGGKYAEYSLSPNWRTMEEEVKREKVKTSSKPFDIRDFRIGDKVGLSDGTEGYITSLNTSGILIVTTKEGLEHLVPIIDIIKKIRF